MPWCKMLLLLMNGLLVFAVQAAPLFSEKDRAWMADNPVIPYVMIEQWPLDFVDQGRHFGLSRAYLDHIEKITGLRFTLADEQQPPAFVTNMPAALMTEPDRARWDFAQRWVTANTLVVTSHDSDHIRTLDHLRTKRVAVRQGSPYEQWLTHNYPEIELSSQPDMIGVLQSVLSGEADAAIGPDLVLRPLLYRRYAHKLVVAGQLPEMVTGLHMAVTPEWEPLRSILSRALASMPASQSDELFRQWVGDLDTGKLTAELLFALYPMEIGLIILLLLSLIWALHRALVHKRRAVLGEARKSQFVAMMSHEIRTPMNALVAALELLRLPASTRLREEYLTLALSSSKNLQGLLNDILDHCKLAQHQLKLESHRFPLRKMIEELEAIYHPLAQQKGLLIRATHSPTLQDQWIVADEHRMRQIIGNLLTNAIKFTDDGQVTLNVQCSQSPKNSPRLHIEVTDTGIGISPQARLTLFKAWTQADNATTRRYDGSGLGLYICHELVTLAGGTLACQSEPGTGSVFRVEMPVVFCEAPVESPPGEALRGFSSDTHILVVEDHPANQKMLAAQLCALGCQFSLAGDGASALALLEGENDFDVILLDCNLPDIDGYEVARRVREFESRCARRATPIVAISALSGPAHQQQCRDSGMDAWLTKPLSIYALSEMLVRWCQPLHSEAQIVLPEQRPDDPRQHIIDDIENFCAAAERRDTRWMVHYAHRLNGVAHLFQLMPLARRTKEIEQRLREGELPTPVQIDAWIVALREWESET